ncbi:MAG: OmpA family protein [Chitinophagales bacterium]|nr:OmpA family protein [Chitinophagales bacterium]MDW8418821.1 OmpA family protein [Chitinophagales bacterium]
MNKRLTLTIVLIGIITFQLTAQKYRVASRSYKTELKIADRFYAEGYFYTAVEYYKDVVRQDSTNRYGTFWLAMALLKSRDYENAEIFFRKFYAMRPGAKENTKRWELENERIYNKGRYYFGEVLHRNGKYDEAIEQLQKFKSTYKPKDETDNMLKLADLEIAGCEYAKNAPKAKVKIKSLGRGVNRAYTESSPTAIADSILYYSSLRTDGKYSADTLNFFSTPKSKLTYALYRSIYAGGEWMKGRMVENKDINTDGYTVGNGAFNKDLTRFYFTKCLSVDDDRPLCNIYVADYNNGKFSNVKRIPEPINEKEKYTSTQPAVRTSDDGIEIIYFVSDRPGGPGGMDIWYFLRSPNGDFKGPKILKGPINTPGDEETPFFDDSTKTLYFSSNGHPGFGGYDVFRSTEQADLSWGPVENLGQPINTGADDRYYSRSTDQTFGFVVSNREGSVPLNGIKTASDDIFGWRNFNYAVQGLVFKEGAEGGGALPDATYRLYKIMPDGSKMLVAVDSVTPAGVRVNAAGIPTGRKNDGSYFFKLLPESDYVIEVARPGFQSKFENITTKGLPDEDTIQNNINIRKAQYVVKGRILEEGKPESVNDALVTLIEMFPNGMEKTVYYMKSNPYYTFEVEMNKKYKIVVRKEGFFAKTEELNTSGLGNIDTIRKDIEMAKLVVGKEYTLQNVLYEFGKATLTESSKQVLDNLYQILIENPTFVIELSAHTDNIGSDAANMKLSQARAESCVKYLMEKGIPKERMVAKGYGESRPKVPNTTEDGKDDPAGRAINRRTEFKILKN